MKIILAPQEFKESVSAIEAARSMRQGVKRVFPNAITSLVPVADGGDGTLEVLIEAMHGSYRLTEATNPLGEKIEVKWGVLPDEKTAVIEMAKVSGLALVPENRRNPLKTTTYGLGEVIRTCLDAGFRKIIIGLGGSATNDAGAGMAQALGVQLIDKEGQELSFGGEQLIHLDKVDTSKIDPRVHECQFIVGCDVTNTLIGPEGATRVYAPQKGADPDMVIQLEAGFRHFAEKVGSDIGTKKWGGAAGGTAAGLAAFLKGTLLSGVDLVLDLLDFDRQLIGTDLVITGEGRLESQFFYQKAPFGVAKRARLKKIPVLAIVGSLGVGFSGVHRQGIDAVIPLTFLKETLTHIPKNATELITQATEQSMRLIKFC